jgi:DNA replication and repair protein RecF
MTPPPPGGPSTHPMWLERLSLSGFRNLGDQVLELPPEGVAFIGANAQGKTNLLESIYYLETFRSFRGATDDRLVRFGASFFRLEGELRSPACGGEEDGERGSNQGERRFRVVSAAVQRSPREKRVSVDGERQARLGDAIGQVGAVLFSPDDVRLVSDGPQLRRRFLDILLSLNVPGYLTSLQRFRHALSQRNAGLRQGDSVAAVQAWDGVLVRAGAEVCRTRSAWIGENASRFSEYCEDLSGAESARIAYHPNVAREAWSGSSEDGVEAYRRALVASWETDRRHRATRVGPHRDEIRLLLGPGSTDRDAREFGSGGQRRTLALALRLLEADTIRRDRGREPILLLDDVFAELDEERARRVLALLERLSPGQVFLTAPKESDVRFREDSLPRGSVRSGEVRTP